jgi:uncharacterized protein YciI
MLNNLFKMTTAGVAAVVLTACSPTIPTLQTVVLQAGPNWKQGEPPEKQDLAAHFAYTKQLFDKGTLIANGPTLDDFRGLYVYQLSERALVEAIVKSDPGLLNGVLSLVEIQTWTPGIENFNAPLPAGQQLFVLHYLPGKSWQAGTTITKQPGFGDTVAYVTKQFDLGMVLAAGPVSETKARVILIARDLAAAQGFAAQDPGVLSSVMKIEVKPWQPFQRQAITRK